MKLKQGKRLMERVDMLKGAARLESIGLAEGGLVCSMFCECIVVLIVCVCSRT